MRLGKAHNPVVNPMCFLFVNFCLVKFMNHEELSVFIFAQKGQATLGNKIFNDRKIPFHTSKLFTDNFPVFSGICFALLSDRKIVLAGSFSVGPWLS